MFPLTQFMFRNEILSTGSKTHEQLFIDSIESTLLRVRCLSSYLSNSAYNSALLSYHQKARFEAVSAFLEDFCKDLRKFEFFGEKDQLELEFRK